MIARAARFVALATGVFGLLGALAHGAAAQSPSASATARAAAGADDAFLDPDARTLHAGARARWHEIDGSLVRYQAVVSQRVAAALRLPIRDRTLYASERSARVIWERDGGVAIQMLGANEHLPSGVDRRERWHHWARLDMAFDPAGDPLILGIDEWGGDDGEMYLVHPLDVGAEEHYRFRTADTLTLSFPDGRSVRAVQLDILPRRDDPHLLSGALWIEPESGNLARAAYRLARPLDIEADTEVEDDDLDDVPGMFKPFVAEITMIAVDYALWDLRVWMPRSLRAEGTARAGILSVPVAFDIAYELEEVVTDADSTEALGLQGALERLTEDAAVEGGTSWRVDPGQDRMNGKRVRYLMPTDEEWLARSPHVPPPIWDDGAAFLSANELDEMKGVLANLPAPARVATLPTFDWGMQRPDLLRYNRVEGLSVGARGAVRFGMGGVPLAASLTARIGSADREPRATLALTRETLTRMTTLSAYHELQLVEPASRAFGLGNSLGALLLGRDDGDYYLSTGVGLTWTPPSSQRQSYRVRAYAERQDSVARRTHGSVAHWVGLDGGFRDAAPAVRADQVGGELTVSPWWGHDPQRPRGGLELQLQGERGDFEFGRARLQARAALPLWRGARLALAAGGGTTFGDAPAQRRWILGGPFSLRGFAPGALTGPSFLSGRAELMAPLRNLRGGSALRLAFFSDGGWAGERDAVQWDAAKASAGVGLSILDGILRLDVARGWKGGSSWRVDLYLDGLL